MVGAVLDTQGSIWHTDHLSLLLFRYPHSCFQCQFGLLESCTVSLSSLSILLCRPNVGFMYQLKLWEAMKCSLDEGHKQYKAYRLQLWARRMKESGYSEVMGLATDPGTDPSAKQPGAGAGEKCFKCRKCRYTVHMAKSYYFTLYSASCSLRLEPVAI